MKNPTFFIISAVCFFSLSPLTLSAQASFGGNATILETGTSQTSQASFGGNATISGSSRVPIAANIPRCIQEGSSWYYTIVATQCQCPNGPVVWSNNGYVSYQCQQYTSPQATQTCWDGSVIMSTFSCPTYKYCPNDTFTKRPTNYTCPSVTQTCPNGVVVSLYQECPQTTSYCNFSGSGWCPQKDSPKVFEWPAVDPNSSAWSWQSNSYSSYFPSYTNYNVNYSVGWRPL